jgi:serine protease Do
LRLVILAATILTAPEAFAFEAAGRPTFADVAERVRDSVVTVAAAVIDKRATASLRKKGDPGNADAGEPPQSYDGFTPERPKRKPGEPVRQFTSVGSGFIIDPSGLIVTNNHVIEGGSEVYVILTDGTELKVDKIIGRDSKTDLTLLKVAPQPGKPLKAAAFGDSKSIRVGDWVIAIGNPFGLNGTVTAGIVSGTGRDINAGPYDEFLQTDAAINRGNSGGPLFNASGEVIGVNTAIFSPSGGSIGLGFAIPSNTARRVIDQLQRYGETHFGTIGVRIQSVSDDIAPNLGLERANGALIARVDRGGAAEAAGLAEGDVILAFGGSPIRNARQLPRLVAQSGVGDEVDVAISRNGERKMLKVKIARLEDKPARPPSAGTPIHPKRQKLGKLDLQH